MVRMKCVSCSRVQSEGKFCLDCGSQVKEIEKSKIKFKKIETYRNSDQLKKDIRTWLTRIGVLQSDIKIDATFERATVEYIYNKQVYSYSSNLQDSMQNNLASVEQFLHGRVLGIERGIESIEKAFAGYEALPSPESMKAINNPYLVFGFKEKVSMELVRSKYKEFAKKYHPDLNKGIANDEWNRIQEALRLIEKEQS